MLPLYQRLGLNAAYVIDGMENDKRQRHYRADIVHTTNKQIAFDYLRDRIEMGEDTGPLKFPLRRLIQQRESGKDPFFLPGLCFALVDEADSVLIDEAKTPLIISKTIPNQDSDDTFSDALYLASVLFVDQDYLVDEKTRVIEFTEDGEEKLAELVINLPKQWQNRRKREMLVKQALNATLFYKKDRDYLVSDDKVQIIDQSTGRIMADRSWEQGLHQMIEAKEGCLISEQREPLARITYQRFFSRYLRLGGASGTISEVAGELLQVYGLEVVRVPTFRPNQRVMMKERLYRNDEARKNAFMQRIRVLHEQQRPVLIGTCSVLDSERVSRWLQTMNLPHHVLNAKQDAREADIIALAGLPGAVTVATNMAGRGTDIALHPKVREQGGLHVLALCRNESARVDRQLYGRCARQGDPGSAEAMIALSDPTLKQFYASAILDLLSRLTTSRHPMPDWISRWILHWPQRNNERIQRRTRQQLMREDRRLQRILAFSGKFE
jgi:preprotein translocase subunit SecA